MNLEQQIIAQRTKTRRVRTQEDRESIETIRRRIGEIEDALAKDIDALYKIRARVQKHEKALNRLSDAIPASDSKLPLYAMPSSVISALYVTCRHYNADPHDVISTDRNALCAHIRFIVCYIARNHFNKNISTIATAIKRDHSTVSYAVQRCQKLLSADPKLLKFIDRLALEATEGSVIYRLPAPTPS